MLLQYQLIITAATLLSIDVTTTAALVIVTGAQVDPGSPSVPPRRNISEIQAENGAQWDLYIQALAAMQAANETDPESYFQISGIHGKPYIEYDQTGPKNTAGWEGYCPHGEKLFLPWHRAYVALFEQVLVDRAKRISMTYPEEHRPRYIEAADTLRAPFWDWAGDEAVPESTVPQTVSITVPENGQLVGKYVENPLHTFKFSQAVLDGQFGSFDDERNTEMYRCRKQNESYPETANSFIKDRNYKSMVYDVFARSSDFEQFATLDSPGNSLEGVHGGIHWDAGCAAQFLHVDFTGFDPLFMLHHSNVDRMWAYWQAMHPDQRLFNGEYPAKNRWSTLENTTVTINSPLAPFRRSETEFHTSETIQSIHDLGYSYHGLERKNRNPEEIREQVTRIINGMAPEFQTLNGGQAGDVSEVERPCSIEVSINGTYMGNLVLMSMPQSGVVHGEIPLDAVYSNLRGKSNRVLVDTLESGLEVEIIKSDGTRSSPANVRSLGIQIEQVQVAAPRSDIELPEYSNSTMLGIRLGNRS
ncbi:tyrosinase 2 [Cordyceps javanica]|uniref:Tyrosinase 2 n=1 Tax=Cordyceps javanica TaxID=43265 RepID=A0A545W637_9HYPO|nr:tyrosinase 2 [Cordyceps javanica]TQW09378.1 tyrosinase 2 [Cordyceps javanica]